MNINPEEGNRKIKDFYLVEDGICKHQSLDVLTWRTDSGQRPSDEWLMEQGYYRYVHVGIPQFDIKTQKIKKRPCTEWIVNDQEKYVSPTYEIIEFTEEEKQQVLQNTWAKLRMQRFDLLLMTDYTQVQDSPLTEDERLAWANYRQELRDLPQNTTDPFNPIWPAGPNGQIMLPPP